ncbi:saxitoxin and tetrodotoxin-binding protein 1-like [Brachionichthys hirsutus]|uniref:saxitoxin and tetrodotoxin-binding protein 1-like n=1 Tax=Brachionichthys hirsutus TaxID=412623 RepID=UPI003604F3BC
MMSGMKEALTLLMLVAIGTNAVMGHQDCGDISPTVPPKDLHKIHGHWILVADFAHSPEAGQVFSNMTSSHVELDLLPDNHTVKYTESNLFQNKSCITYFMNATVHADEHTLQIEPHSLLDVDGVTRKIIEQGNVTFHETCTNCLILVYRGGYGNFLLAYRKEGHHDDVTQIDKGHADLKRLAECLGILHESDFHFNKNAELCGQKSPAED